jgi:hypothetical protein
MANATKDTQVRISVNVYSIIQAWAKKGNRPIKAQIERMIMASHQVLKDLEKTGRQGN